jgi:AhpD family alkylhydroperoxidase
MTTVETTMTAPAPRLPLARLQADAYRSLVEVDKQAGAALEPGLRHLIEMRASQINGCAYCLDMHSKDARAGGESEQRLYVLDAWREAPFYTERERAALAYTEAATRVADTHVPDDVFEPLRAVFRDEEIAALIMTVAVINAWNRIAVSSRAVAGSYRPARSQG